MKNCSSTKCKITKDDVNNSTLASMVQTANANGYVARAFELKIGKTGREFKRYYLDELSYIKRFAPYKYKSLTQISDTFFNVFQF